MVFSSVAIFSSRVEVLGILVGQVERLWEALFFVVWSHGSSVCGVSGSFDSSDGLEGGGSGAIVLVFGVSLMPLLSFSLLINLLRVVPSLCLLLL